MSKLHKQIEYISHGFLKHFHRYKTVLRKQNSQGEIFKNVALEYHYTKYHVDNKSQNCINDFNHRVIIIHLVSAKFQKSRGFITFHPSVMEKGIYKE